MIPTHRQTDNARLTWLSPPRYSEISNDNTLEDDQPPPPYRSCEALPALVIGVIADDQTFVGRADAVAGVILSHPTMETVCRNETPSPQNDIGLLTNIGLVTNASPDFLRMETAQT